MNGLSRRSRGASNLAPHKAADAHWIRSAMTNFPIDRVLEIYERSPPERRHRGGLECAPVLEVGATDITRAKRLVEADDVGLEVWEVTLEGCGPPISTSMRSSHSLDCRVAT